MKIFIAQYQGVGPLSFGIRFATNSNDSHSALIIKHNGIPFTLYEAWGFKGVVKVEGESLLPVLSANHHSGTQVSLFAIDLPLPDMDFLEAQVGCKYDWALLSHFITRIPASVNDRWICSELTAEFCKRSGKVLQNMPTWKMAPEHVGISPRLKKHSKIKTI